MNTYDLIAQNFDELYHYGILGQKWGVRRYQNPDGSLTEAGKKRYGYNSDSDLLAMKNAEVYESMAYLTEKKNRIVDQIAKDPKKDWRQSKDWSDFQAEIPRNKALVAEREQIQELLTKKYSHIKTEFLTEEKTGEGYVQTILKTKLGETYVSEFYLGIHTVDVDSKSSRKKKE